MKNIYKKVLILLITITIFSCSNNDENSILPPELNDINPKSGPKNTVVIISGSNFGSDVNRIQVFFNEVLTSVQSVNENEIKTIVPARAFTGRVKVIIDGVQLIGPEFNYILSETIVTTLAGSTEGSNDGVGENAQFNFPADLTVDELGNVFVADAGNDRIRKITPDGLVTTLAGSTEGSNDGVGANAQFNDPRGIGLDVSGNIYVADFFNDRIRKITPNGEVSTIAGSSSGFTDGVGANAQFDGPRGIAVNTSGIIYVADRFNRRIRKVTPDGVVTTLAGSGVPGFADGFGSDAEFNLPGRLTLDNSENIILGDPFNQNIRKITPEGLVSTIAGTAQVQGSNDGNAITAQFTLPYGVAVDALGNIYIADSGNNKIRKITPEGIVETFAGSTQGSSDGLSSIAQFDRPRGIAVDNKGNIYLADSFNNRIRKVTQE